MKLLPFSTLLISIHAWEYFLAGFDKKEILLMMTQLFLRSGIRVETRFDCIVLVFVPWVHNFFYCFPIVLSWNNSYLSFCYRCFVITSISFHHHNLHSPLLTCFSTYCFQMIIFQIINSFIVKSSIFIPDSSINLL